MTLGTLETLNNNIEKLNSNIERLIAVLEGGNVTPVPQNTQTRPETPPTAVKEEKPEVVVEEPQSPQESKQETSIPTTPAREEASHNVSDAELKALTKKSAQRKKGNMEAIKMYISDNGKKRITEFLGAERDELIRFLEGL